MGRAVGSTVRNCSTRLGRDLPSQGILVARMNYRLPDEFDECLLDTMAALAFLQGWASSGSR